MKKAATGRKSNGRIRTTLIKEDRYNAALELSIKEEKENEIHQLSSEEDKDKQFDLAVENQTSERFKPEFNGKRNSVSPKSTKNSYSSEPATPAKPLKHTDLHLVWF